MISSKKNNQALLEAEVSLYIDCLRIVSAALVFIAHLRFEFFKGQWLGNAVDFGVEGVVVFFVISGFVIHYAAKNLEDDFVEYAINRLSRLYSVIFPFLLLGFTLNCLVSSDSLLDKTVLNEFFTSIFFLNEIWFFSTVPYNNPPYWSVCYEFWYYVFFGVFLYVKSYKKYFYLLILFIFTGPQILLLFPSWLIGVGTYYLYENHSENIPYKKTLYYGSLLIFVLCIVFDVRFMLDVVVLKYLPFLNEAVMSNASDVLSFYFFGFFVAVNLLSFSGSTSVIKKFLLQNVKLIKRFANMTFTMYVFHFPLFYIYSGLFDTFEGYEHTFLIAIFSLLTIFLIAPITEGKKYVYRKNFNRIVNNFNSKDFS